MKYLKTFFNYLFNSDIKILLIIILATVIFFMRACGGNDTTDVPTEKVKVNGKTYEVLKHTRDTIYVPKYITITKKGEDIYHDTTIYVKVPMDVDTAQILKDFFAKNVYTDTLKLDDSLGLVTIRDTISQNKIVRRTFTAKINQKEITDTLILKQPNKAQVYVGVNAGVDKVVGINNVGGSILFKDKKDKIYQIGVGVVNRNNGTLTPYINGGLYWKIKLKK